MWTDLTTAVSDPPRTQQRAPRSAPAVSELGAAYWEHAARGVFAIQSCADCGAAIFPPKPVCPVCWSGTLQWREATGLGHVESFSVIHRPPSEAFAADVPYVVALVRLSEGPRMMTNIVDCDPETVSIDMPVRVVFGEYAGHALPQFAPVAS